MSVEYPELARWLGLRRSLVIVVPHPDDETIGCGGLIVHAQAAGIACHIVVLTDGAASHSESAMWSRQARIDVRHAECINALEILGVNRRPVFFDLPDAQTLTLPRSRRDAIAARLSTMIDRIKPDLVLTTWRREPHCDHQFAFTLANDAVAASRHRARLVEYMVWTPITGSTEDKPSASETEHRLFDIGFARDRKIAALGAHRSQLGEVFTDTTADFTLTPDLFLAMTTRCERYDLAL